MSTHVGCSWNQRLLGSLWGAVVPTVLLLGCRSSQEQSEPPPEIEEPAAQQEPAEPQAKERSGPSLWGGAVPPQMADQMVGSTATMDLNPSEGDEEAGEFVVAPVPFFSEQVGFGLGLGAAYLFQIDPKSSPSKVAAGGFYTENESKGAFAGFKPNFAGDAWRLSLVAGVGDVNYDFYGIGQGSGEDDASVPFGSEVEFQRVEALYAIRDKVYLGPRVTRALVKTDIGDDEGLVELPEDSLDVDSVLLGVQLLVDSRDDSMYPVDGALGELTADASSTDLGSTLGYSRYTGSYASYGELGDETVIAWQWLAEYADEDTPFFALPTHKLRGYEAGRYRDRFWTAGQIEIRHRLTRRYGIAAFGGVGAVAASVPDLWDSTPLPSVGAGLRIRLAEENPVDYRIDMAIGIDDEWILSMSVGQAF